MAESNPNGNVPDSGKQEKDDNKKDVDANDVLASLSALLEKTSIRQFLGGIDNNESVAKEKSQQLLSEVTFNGVCQYIEEGKSKNIVIMTGAGISTSAGIPDFRSPGSGLYDNLEKFNLPNPQAIFDIGFFRENPEPFFVLAKQLWPGVLKPTPCHYFINMLHEKGLLLRTFTQNIDTLERAAGIPVSKIVEAHGTFHTSHCISCKKEYSQQWMKDQIFAEETPVCTECSGVVKPDIVFFGESLPDRFFQCVKSDFEECDLLIVMGSSLVVQPFASLVGRVPDTTPRLYINLTKTEVDPFMAMMGLGSGFMFDSENNFRDVFWQGNCDDGCQAIADKLGWGDELKEKVKKEHTRIDDETSKKATGLHL